MAIVHEMIENPSSVLGVSENGLGKRLNVGQAYTGTSSAEFSTAAIDTSGSKFMHCQIFLSITESQNVRGWKGPLWVI